MTAGSDVFSDMMKEFAIASANKGIRRAMEKGRPMDPWNHFDKGFIRLRLQEEIAEWQNSVGYSTTLEMDELKDIACLAGSLWAILTGWKEAAK